MAISSEDAAKLQGFYEATESVRKGLEQTWGVGRLEAIAGRVNPMLLARFRAQQERWRVTLRTAWDAEFLSRDMLDAVEQKAGAMQRGWIALDANAEEAGERPIAPWVWEVRLEDGSIAAFVQTDAEVGKVMAEGRHVHVYTATEVGCLISLLPQSIQMAKQEFPGAKLGIPDPYRRHRGPIPWDDPIPFGDGAVDAGEPPD